MAIRKAADGVTVGTSCPSKSITHIPAQCGVLRVDVGLDGSPSPLLDCYLSRLIQIYQDDYVDRPKSVNETSEVRTAIRNRIQTHTFPLYCIIHLSLFSLKRESLIVDDKADRTLPLTAP